MNANHRIENYLDEHHVPYEIIDHVPTATSLHTAHSAHIDPARLAKGVLLEGDDACLVVAMIPADQEIQLGQLQVEYGSHLHLADEATVRRQFDDCDPGAVPGLAIAWGVETVWDDSLLAQPDIHLEAGDHRHLIHVQTRNLQMALEAMTSCHFSAPKHMH